MTGNITTLEREAADRDGIAISESDGRLDRPVGVGRHRCTGKLNRLSIPLRMVGVPVCIKDLADRESLRLGTSDKGRRRVGGINQHSICRVAVAQKIPKISVTTGADLFKNKLHGRIIYDLRVGLAKT